MPFCTQCGHSNPDDSRFCSNCGAALKPAAPAPPSPGETSTITIGGGFEPGEPAEQGRGPLHRRPGRRRRAAAGLGAARRHARAERRQPVPARLGHHDRRPAPGAATSSSTTSRSPAGTRSSSAVDDGFSVRDVGCLNGTYVNRERIDDAPLAGGDEVQIGKYRLVFYPSAARAADEPRADERGAALPVAHEHRRGARAAARRVPRRHDLEDPVPRVRGAGRAGAHAVRLPQVLPRRRRPAALRAGRAARPLPAAAGHQGAPRRARPRPRAAGRRRRSGRRCRVAPVAADGLPGPRRVRARRTELRLSRDELLDAAGIDAELLDRARGATGWSPVRGRGGERTTTATRWSIATDRRRDGAASASSRGTCARSAPRPTARSAWSSRSSRRCCGSATRRPGPGPRRSPASWRALSRAAARRAGAGRAARRRRPLTTLDRAPPSARRRSARVGWPT